MMTTIRTRIGTSGGLSKISVLMISAVLTGLVAVGTPARAADSDTFEHLKLFGDVFERVREDYVEEPEDEKLVEDAINGMLQGLDPHSSYLNPRDFREMQVQTRGEYGGLGIEVTMEEGVIKVISPIEDTPADRAGLKAGDLITHIDGEPILGMTLNEAIDQMRGKPGEPITITVLRQGEKPFDVTIVREIIEMRPVIWRIEGTEGRKDIAYLRVRTFNEHSAEKLEEGISELNDELGDTLAGYIVDLRGNPGGLLQQSVAISDMFLDRGEIVSTRGRRREDTQRFNARRGVEIKDGKPIVVLINGGSASASEIVAGALQDHEKAILVGTKTFGKGSVQTVLPLGNGTRGALRLTTARYYTPSGRSIHGTGIEPDVNVEIEVIEPEEEGGEPTVNDTQLERAISILHNGGKIEKQALAQ